MDHASLIPADIAAIADEDLGRHHQTPSGPLQILYHQMGLTLHDSSEAPCELLHVQPFERASGRVPPTPGPLEKRWAAVVVRCRQFCRQISPH